jgi:hypothetical protein
VGGEAVVPSVAREKEVAGACDLAGHDVVRGRAERRDDAVLGAIAEPGHLVEAAASDHAHDALHSGLHRSKKDRAI